jgi:hypothetical protein
MHKIYEYLCDELKSLEKKVESGQGLSMNELEYLDKLTETKKNLLKIEMLEEDSEYSGARGRNYAYDSMDMRSYARGRGRNARRDAMGRYSSTGYSRAEDDFMSELEDLMRKAPDDAKRQKIQHLIDNM